MRRWLMKALLWLGGLLLVLTIGAWLYLRSSLPDYSAGASVDGLDASVEILRDADAVPHILAASQKDAAFALGYAHAQDRLWQLEMNRRIGQGRLSEIFGKEALETDRFMRTLGFYRIAQKNVALLDADTRKVLQAYADGINAYLKNRKGALPVEFLAMGLEPAPWQPADSIVWLKLMSLDLGYQWRTELARFSLASRLTPDRLQELLPPYPGEKPLATLPKPDDIFQGILPPALDAQEVQGKGSNNWVVAGSRTVSGKPLLANDPHLTITTPGIWYLAHLRMGDRNAVGVTMPAVPFIVLGRTDRLAWGFTNTGPDTQDLLIEKIIDPARATYATPAGDAVFASREEVIAVKDSTPVKIIVRESRNGPILSDALDKVKARLGQKYAMAIRWTALDPDDPTMRAGLKLNLARSVEDAMAAATDFKTPQQNIVMADTAGNIGYLAAGRVPIRPANNTTQGLMPAPGWLAENDWIGEIPYEKLPRAYNPDSGYIATANQKIHAPDYPFTITRDFEDPDRYNRIVSLLTATAKHSIDSFQKIQADIYSEPAVRMRNRIVPILKGQKSIAPDMIAALETWNGEMDANQPQPLIMTAWQRAFVKRVTEDDLGPLFKDNWRLRTRFVEAILLGQSNSASWCDVQTTGVPEKCSDMIVAAMHDSIKQLSASQGADWKKWRWGNVHKAVAKHQPFSNVPQLAKFFETRVEVGGSSSTVNVAHPRIGDKGTYESDLLASYRGIFDLSDLEKSLYVMPGGQSGNVFSPQYRDMVERWAKLHYRTIPTRDTEIEVNTRNRLSLTARKS